MKVTVQVLTNKGFYGAPQSAKINMIDEASLAIIELMERLPERIEGERFTNWTNVDIRIDRGG